MGSSAARPRQAATAEASGLSGLKPVVVCGPMDPTRRFRSWQTYRFHQAVERLRASVAPTATALRDGTWQEIPLRAVVAGDVVRLSAGDLVPADARLLEARDLSVQQSMLTGESLPADKTAGDASSETGPAAPHLVFLGTSIISGTGTALVITTGPETLFGDIAARGHARARNRVRALPPTIQPAPAGDPEFRQH